MELSDFLGGLRDFGDIGVGIEFCLGEEVTDSVGGDVGGDFFDSEDVGEFVDGKSGEIFVDSWLDDVLSGECS